MHTQRLSALARIALVTAVAIGLAGCGSDAQEPAASQQSATSTPQVLGAPQEADLAAGYALPDCTGLSATECSYDGFDPTIDGFGFANWGETGRIGATEMIMLFGRKAVCASYSGSRCVLYPAAKQWAAQVNEGMSGGHCEGMAVLAARLFLGYDRLDRLDPLAESTFDLSLDTPAVEKSIDLWWATQMLPSVQAAYQEFQAYQPSEIAAELADGLARGTGYTLGIYSEAGGHAVTPIAVTDENGKIAVSVYDNNFPGTVQRIMIDPRAEHWSYAMGSTNPDAPTGGWEGGIGTMDLTPMESRSLPTLATFEDGNGKGNALGKTSNVLVSSPDPDARLGLLLTIDGQTYDTSDPAVRLPDGVTARSTLGSPLAGKGLTVTVDRAKVGAFRAAMTAPDGQAASAPATMSIDDARSPRVTLRGTMPPEGADGASFAVGRGGRVTIDTAEFADAQVNVSNRLNSADFLLPDGLDMSIDSRDSDGISGIEYIGDDGDIIGAYDLAADNDGNTVMDIVADFDPETGDFDITMTEAEEEEFDSALLAEWGLDLAALDDEVGADEENAVADEAATDDATDMSTSTGDAGDETASEADSPNGGGSDDSANADDTSSGDSEDTSTDADTSADVDTSSGADDQSEDDQGTGDQVTGDVSDVDVVDDSIIEE